MASAVAPRRGVCYGPPESGALLAYTGGRWKLWREEEVLDVSHNDASELYTAACWLVSKASCHIIALGCASGRIQAWDLQTGESLGPTAQAFHAIVQGADAAVTCLASPRKNRGTVFACCLAVADVLEIGLADGSTRATFSAGQSGLCQLALTQSGPLWLLSASPGKAMKLWRMPNAGGGVPGSKAAARLASPANAPTSLDLCCSGGRLLALCADGTMQMDLIDCGPADGTGLPSNKQVLPATRVLSCHERIRTAHFAPGPAGGASVLVVGYGPSIVAMWRFDAGMGNARTLPPIFSVSSKEMGAKILAGRAVPAELSLSIAFGPLSKPSFATGKHGKNGVEVIRRIAPAEAELKEPKASAVAFGATSAPQPILLGPTESAAHRQISRKRPLPEGGNGIAASRPKFQDAVPAVGATGSGISLAPIVRQGLRAKDSSSLDQVLFMKDRPVMDSTVVELSSPEAFDLLQECTKRLIEKPVHGAVLCGWIQRILQRHAGFIASHPTLHGALQPLCESSTSRLASYRALLRLQGRLQSLVAMGKQVIDRKVEEKNTLRAPLLDYVEADDDAEEEEPSEAGLPDANDHDAGEEDDDDPDLDDDWLDSDDE